MFTLQIYSVVSARKYKFRPVTEYCRRIAEKDGNVTFLFIIFFIGRGFIILQTEKRMMSGLYAIPLAGLKEGRYTYEFVIGDDFFKAFEESEIHRGELRADVVLDKRSTHLELNITVSGFAEVVCDRCLERFPIRISCNNKLFVKQGKEWEEADPDMITITPDEHQIDLSQYIYEYIHLALPIKRIHPDDVKGNSTCDPEMIKQLRAHLIEGEGRTDPRWEELRKLTKNSKN